MKIIVRAPEMITLVMKLRRDLKGICPEACEELWKSILGRYKGPEAGRSLMCLRDGSRLLR